MSEILRCQQPPGDALRKAQKNPLHEVAVFNLLIEVLLYRKRVQRSKRLGQIDVVPAHYNVEGHQHNNTISMSKTDHIRYTTANPYFMVLIGRD